MTTTPSDPTIALPGRPPVVDLATWQAARNELLVREKAHTREGDALAAARRRLPMVEIDGTVEVVGPDGPVPFLELFQGRDDRVVYHSMWYRRRATPGPVRGLHLQPLAHEGRRLPQRPRRLLRRADLGPVGGGGSLRRVHGLSPALVLGARRGGADRHRGGAHRLLPPRRRPRVPDLLHDRPGQRAGRRLPRPARHDALRPPRGVGGRPGGLARIPGGRCAGRGPWRADLLVLAL